MHVCFDDKSGTEQEGKENRRRSKSIKKKREKKNTIVNVHRRWCPAADQMLLWQLRITWLHTHALRWSKARRSHALLCSRCWLKPRRYQVTRPLPKRVSTKRDAAARRIRRLFPLSKRLRWNVWLSTLLSLLIFSFSCGLSVQHLPCSQRKKRETKRKRTRIKNGLHFYLGAFKR